MTNSSVPPPMVPSARDRAKGTMRAIRNMSDDGVLDALADASEEDYRDGWNAAITARPEPSVLPRSNRDVQMPSGAAVPPGTSTQQSAQNCYFLLQQLDTAQFTLAENRRRYEEDHRQLTEIMYRERNKLRDELVRVTKERDDYRAKAYELAEAEGKLKDNCVRLEAINTLLARRPDGHQEPCLICGEPCSSLAGNPSLWPVRLGNNGWHHVGCINKELAELARLKAQK